MCAFGESHEMYEYNSLQILPISFRLIHNTKRKINTLYESLQMHAFQLIAFFHVYKKYPAYFEQKLTNTYFSIHLSKRW